MALTDAMDAASVAGILTPEVVIIDARTRPIPTLSTLPGASCSPHTQR